MRRMIRPTSWLFTGIAILAAAGVPAAGVYLVLDINQTPGSAPNTTAGSFPSEFTEFDGHMVFVADDGIHGRELWQSDGTADGTKVIVDLVPGTTGSKPNSLVVANNHLFFYALDAQGTWHLMSLVAGSTTPVSLAQLSYNFCGSVALNGKLLLTGTGTLPDGTPQPETWETDGSPGGTKRLDATAPFDYLCEFQKAGDTVYAEGLPLPGSGESGSGSGVGDDITYYSITGALANAQLFAAFHTRFSMNFGTQFKGKWYLTGSTTDIISVGGYYDPVVSRTHSGIFRLDGAPNLAPTELLGADSVSNNYSGAFVGLLGVSGEQLVVARYSASGQELSLVFSSDGTDFETLPYTFSSPVFIDGKKTFTTLRAAPAGLDPPTIPWVTDGTVDGTHQLSSIGPSGASSIFWFDDYQGTTLFTLLEPTQGVQLWRTDGTSAGTALISNLPFDPFTAQAPIFHGAAAGLFYLSLLDPARGQELYVYASGPVVPDVTGTSLEGKPVQLSIASKAHEPGETIDATSVKIASAPSHGSVTAGVDGTITYTPDAGYRGSDTFTYTINDSSGATSVPAKATIAVFAAAATGGSGTVTTPGGGGGALHLSELLMLLSMFVIRSLPGGSRLRWP